MSSFLDQASLVASEAWAARLPSLSPPLIHLELEALVTKCLVSDLADRESPAHRALFHEPTRTALISALAGERGAWSPELLKEPFPADDHGLGTVFFWTHDPKGRSVALGLGERKGQSALLGSSLTIPLAPGPVATAIAKGLLIPGLFLDYLVLSVHGLRVFGGVFMIDYLPSLLTTASKILEVPLASQKDPASQGADSQGLVGREPLLGAGLLPIGLADPEAHGGFAAAGALELNRSLSRAFFQELSELKIKEVRSFSLWEWYQEETPMARRFPGWEKPLGPPAITLKSP